MNILLILAALLLSAALIFFIRKERKLSARAEKLQAEIEACLRGEGTIPASVADDAFARLENSAAELAARLHASRECLRREGEHTENLIADLSHQLKTPLAALRLYCELESGAHAGKMLASIDRMEHLVYSVLRLEKLHAGAYPFRFQKHQLSAIAREAMEDISALYPGRNIAIKGDASVRCDAQWMHEAIGNLLKNACEHTPEGKNIEIIIEPSESTVRLWVEDEGGGVSPGEEEKLFERFYRRAGADGTGAGIGLAIVRAVARGHHGEAWVENAGHGLRVTISLPLLSHLKDT